MAVMTAGAVTVLAPSGSQVATIPAVEGNPPRGIALSRTRLAVARTFTLDLYDPATGAEEKSLARTRGGNAPRGRQREGRVPPRSTSSRAGPPEQWQANLAPTSLEGHHGRLQPHFGRSLYVYNDRGVSAKGRIVFEPTGELLDRF